MAFVIAGPGTRAAVLCAWVLAASVPARALDEAPAPPRLQVDEETVDVGEVPKGETRTATFRLRNVGGETLKILRVKPG